MNKSFELKSLRAKRGKAKEKKELLEEYASLETMGWHFVILASGNENSTYNGMYPEGIGNRRDTHAKVLKALEEKIRSVCH